MNALEGFGLRVVDRRPIAEDGAGDRRLAR
jgi:hypothetical protein